MTHTGLFSLRQAEHGVPETQATDICMKTK